MHSPLAQQHAQAAPRPACRTGPTPAAAPVLPAPARPAPACPAPVRPACVPQRPSAASLRSCRLRLLGASRAPSPAQRLAALCSMGSSPFQVLHTFFFFFFISFSHWKIPKKYIYLFSFIFQYTNKFIKIYFIYFFFFIS